MSTSASDAAAAAEPAADEALTSRQEESDESGGRLFANGDKVFLIAKLDLPSKCVPSGLTRGLLDAVITQISYRSHQRVRTPVYNVRLAGQGQSSTTYTADQVTPQFTGASLED